MPLILKVWVVSYSSSLYPFFWGWRECVLQGAQLAKLLLPELAFESTESEQAPPWNRTDVAEVAVAEINRI